MAVSTTPSAAMLLTHGQLSGGKSGCSRRSPYIHHRALVLYPNKFHLPDHYPATAASLFHLFARDPGYLPTETAINVYLGT